MIPFARTSDGPPKTYILDLEPENGEDLSVVTSAVLHVRRPDGSKTTWTPAMSNKTATSLRLTHLYTVGIFPKSGPYVIYASLTTPDGTLTSAPRELDVKDAFDVT